jgi:hypothetical protein
MILLGKKKIREAAEHFILAENADLMGMVGRKSFQYAPPWLEHLYLSQFQDNQEHKIPLLPH